MPLISIILPTYNNEATIEESIESVLSQTISDYELIVCDDGSTDKTSEIMESFSNNPKIKYVRIEHTGEPAKVRNMAAKHIQGKYIAFIDSDDIWLNDKLENDIAFYEKHPELGYLFSDTADYLGDTFDDENFDGTWVHKFKTLDKIKKCSNLITYHEKDHYIFSSSVLEFVLNWTLSATPAMMIKREVFEEMKGYDEVYKTSQDFDLMLRIVKKYPIGYIDKIGVKRRRHQKSITMTNISRSSTFALRILLEHMPAKNMYLDKSNYLFAKDQISLYSFLLGYDAFCKNNFNEAKQYFKDSFRYKKTLKTLSYYFISLLPHKLIVFLRNIKQKTGVQD